MSEQALVDTIRVELRQKRETGADYVLLTPGNYGSDFIRDTLGIDPRTAVQVSNFVGDALDICRELGFRGALLICHIGKLVKIGGGMLNTHSKYGDCRLEILASQAAAEGMSKDGIGNMLQCVSCGEVCGYVFCIFRSHPADNILTDVKTLYLDDLCVDENARGQGVGRLPGSSCRR